MENLKIIVLTSNSSNYLETIIDASRKNILPISISMVISQDQSAHGLVKASMAEIADVCVATSEIQAAEMIRNSEKDLVIVDDDTFQPSSLFTSSIQCPILQVTTNHTPPVALSLFQKGTISNLEVQVIQLQPQSQPLHQYSVPIYSSDTLDHLVTRITYHASPLLVQAIEKLYQQLVIPQTPLQRRMANPIKKGKVRDIYDVGHNLLLMKQTDRQSAFDRHICDIPDKGRVLTHASAWWFQKTRHIIPNHFIAAKDDTMLVKACRPIPLEIVVRGYITGSTSTSLWTNYSKDPEAPYCGIYFPSGLKKNQRLPEPVVTPTTKADEHDELISPNEILERQILTPQEWTYISNKAIELFQYGQQLAQERGLILVDTKYEFGRPLQTHSTSLFQSPYNIILIDELHTCDSSRYWLEETYQARFESNSEPDRFDKDIIRQYIRSQTSNPYQPNPLPDIPQNLITTVSHAYQAFYTRLTQTELAPLLPATSHSKKQNMEQLVNQYLVNTHSPTVIIFSGSTSDAPFVKEISEKLDKENINNVSHVCSAYKNIAKLLRYLRKYQDQVTIDRRKLIFVTVAGPSNTLSEIITSQTTIPTLSLPLHPFKDTLCLSQVPVLTILDIDNAVLAIKRIFDL